MPSVDIIRDIGPVTLSTEFLNASDGLFILILLITHNNLNYGIPSLVYLLNNASTAPWTPPRIVHLSPYMSLLYSLSSVVPKANGAPMAMAHPIAKSVAIPL